MGSRYDSRTTTFSPEGRLYQVEYAIRAIDNAGACIGILAKDGVVIAAEKRDLSKLLAKTKTSEKLYKIDDHIVCAVAGLTSDANVLLGYLRRVAQNYKFQYQEPQPLESMIRTLCDLKQGYTQFGGQRPFGVSFLYAGWDRHHGFQLYQSDPSGNYSGWKACAIGSNNQNATTILRNDYNEEMSTEEAVQLAIKVLHKTMDTANPSAEKIEFSILRKEEGSNKLHQDILEEDQVQKYLDVIVEEEKQKAEAEKAKQKS
mmetsp:Transcript_14974/g.18526  ORF Transcript_14974/g.18526 Transcript_14974/m.18526 type:complete len:259 (+) Transcript_14974:224-1000(+)|eukprot:CAMPEP_0204824698 /NCGR_PEP_ID=MMETSP1346-20131115/2686_1 /ASSEMBLY_ACC=CAM_ASM_000771 /TAXON_ID=215587 /ORGANISM="Aplanochytrium stocchinoi, Strain GSBS06" /LENGTH=258 /DNA_ID=CAMNT_0051951989 /DNA_START=238 /DNA_END=1014 /DNA_ORIENTATION=-